MTVCPCTSGLEFDACCGPYIKGEKNAPTAEAMLRSRYTAFAMTEIDYIRNTRHPRSQNEFDEESARDWSKNSTWLGLEVLTSAEGGEKDSKGTIDFIAKYEQNGEMQDHREKATFIKAEDDRWYFQDGDFIKPETFVRKDVKVGRNDPCPCGSGKKFKKCCG